MFFFGKTEFLGQNPNIPLDRSRQEPWMGGVDGPTGVYLFEHRHEPSERRLAIHVVGE